MTESRFPVAPAPWTLKADVYSLLMWLKGPLVEDAYSPLEAAALADSAASAYKGGLAGVQIIRYHDTPVGKYDEIFFVPGAFEVPRAKDGTKRPDNLRITRIYVNQKETTWNGRKNWNIPKHLARFEFENLIGPERMKVQIFSPDPSVKIPFFTAIFQPMSYLPAFKLSTNWIKYTGMAVMMALPPIPAGRDEELVGTTEWLQSEPLMTCSSTRVCWTEIKQPPKGSGEGVDGWFPQVKPMKVGLWMQDATMVLGEPNVLSIQAE